MVDTLALGASAARREGSSPFIRTKTLLQELLELTFFCILDATTLHK
jgi:hypothetical protein